MLEAFGWGLVAGSSFLVGGLIALRWRVGDTVILGVLTGFGAGALLSAVAYKLIEEAGRMAGGSGFIAVGLTGGAITAALVVSDKLRGGSLSGKPRHEPSFYVVALSVVAESVVLTGGLIGDYGISGAVLAAIFLCGVPEAMGDTGPLRAAGISKAGVLAGWMSMLLLCGLATAVFTALLRPAPKEAVALVLAFAGGGILTYVTVHMVPEGIKDAGAVTGIAVALGFGLSFGLVEFLGAH